jgi:hypothetical protein
VSAEEIKAGGVFWEILVDDKSGPALADAEKAFERHTQKIAASGAAITKSLRTPKEIYADTLKELHELRASGVLTAETFSRGSAEALQTFYKATGEAYQAAASQVQMLGRNVAIVGAGITAVAGAGLAGLGASLREFADFGSEINDLTARTGLDAAWAQSFKASAGLAGASIGDVEAAIRKMQKTLAKEGKLKGMPTEQQFMAVADEISRIEDPTLRAARAMEIFGKSGTKILPMIEGGAAALREQFEFLQSHGLILSDEDILMADDLGDAWDFLGMTMAQVVRIIGASLAPEILALVKGMSEGIAVVGGFIEQNRGLVKVAALLLLALGGAGAAIVAVGTAIMFVGGVIAAIGVILPLLPGLIAAVGAAFAFMVSPVGLVIGAVAALLALLPALAYVLDASFFDGAGLQLLVDGFSELWGIANQTIRGIFDALASGDWEAAGNIAMLGLNLAWTTGLAWLRIGWAEFAAWILKAMVDLFGSEMIGIILKGAKGVVDAINEAAAFFGLDGIGGTDGLDAMIAAAEQGNQALKDLADGAVSAIAEDEGAKIDAAQRALDTLTNAAAASGQTKADATRLGDARNEVQPDGWASKQSMSIGTFSAGAAGLINQMQPQFDGMEKKQEKANELLERIATATEDDEGEGAGE